MWHTAFGDGRWVQRTYDNAGYLTSLNNHRGEVHYVARDVDGKESARATYNAAGGLAAASSQQYTGHGRLKTSFDASNNPTHWLYHPDGRPRGVTNALNQTRTVQLDLLNRATSTTQPNTTAMRQQGGPATVSTSHAYHPTRAHKMSTTDTVAVTTSFGPDRYNQPVSEAGADAGNKVATRNAAGDVVSLTDARGVVYTIGLDSLGRINGVAPAGGAATTVSYVPGRSDALPASMTDPSGSTSWTYDSAGRMLSKTQTVSGTSARTLSLTRDSLGRISSMTYPSGMRVDASYGADGVSALGVNGLPLLNNVSYRAFSPVATSWTWGNGSTYSRNIDANGRVTQVSLGQTQRSYVYDAVGRITTQADIGYPVGNEIRSIAYDEAGQITSFAGGSDNYTYGYDTNGNRRTVTRNGSTSANTYAAGTNRILTSPNGTYSYNIDGNPSGDGYYSFTYDSYGRWNLMRSADYRAERRHNGQGLRVAAVAKEYVSGGILQKVRPSAAGMAAPLTSKLSQALATDQAASDTTAKAGAGAAGTSATSSSATKAGAAAVTGTWVTTDSRHFFHDDEGRLLGEYDMLYAARSYEVIWFNGQPVAVMANGVLHYIHADHLGTPRVIVRASDNTMVWRWESEPFGANYPTGSLGGVEFNLRFPGQQYDSMTGYYYNVMRDYNPWTGRYVQADPIGLAGGMSRYAYALSNPSSWVDQDGMQARPPRSGGTQPLFPRIGPSLSEVAGPYSTTSQSTTINEISNSRGRLGYYSESLLSFFGRSAEGTITMTTTRDGSIMFQNTLPNGTRIQYRQGPDGPRVDIIPPGGTPETMHGSCLKP